MSRRREQLTLWLAYVAVLTGLLFLVVGIRMARGEL